MTEPYSLFLISHKPETHAEIQRGLGSETLRFYHGANFPSFSRLVNRCVADAHTETVIIMSHKVRPNSSHVKRTLELLDQGYAFVGLHMFRFFGFRKELFREIGFFDERYVGGGFEDYDFVVRMIENNLAFYTDESVPMVGGPSSWEKDGMYPGYPHWCTKWKHFWNSTSHLPIPERIERTMSEEAYNYDLGPSTGIKFLRGRENCFNTNFGHVGAFFEMDIVSGAKLRFTRTRK
jgi:hypothetical protein